MTVDVMQFGFMPERGMIDACVYLEKDGRRCKGEKLYMCFMDLDKAFSRVPRKVLELAMWKKEIPEVLVRSVMSLYEGARTRVRVDFELSEEFEVKVGIHHGSVLSPFLCTVVVDVIEFTREGALIELLYVDDLVLMSETIEGLRNKFLKWKESFESNCLKVNLGKTKVVVSGGITKDDMSTSKVDPGGVCSLRVKGNSVLCTVW